MSIHKARILLVRATECLKQHTDKYTRSVTWEVISSSMFTIVSVYTYNSPIMPSWQGQEIHYIR